MSLGDLQRNNLSLAFVLEIAGVTTRYWSGQRPPTTSIQGLGGVNYTDVEAIASVGRQSSKLNELGGVSDHGSVGTTLTSRADRATENDPMRVLMRLGDRGVASSERAILLESIPHATTVPSNEVVVDRDLTSWPADAFDERYFHIGHEMFRATGVASGPHRFTGVSRAVAGSRISAHLYNEARSCIPFVTAHPTSWKNRPAVLRVAARVGRALVASDYYEVIRGFLDADPTISGDGLSIQVRLAPLSAILERRIGTNSATTGLLQGYHWFSEGQGDVLMHRQTWDKGAAWAAAVTNNVAAGVTPLISVVDDRREQLAAFTHTTLAEGHPRRMRIDSLTSQGVGGLLPADLTAPNTVEVSNNVPVALAIGGGLWNLATSEIKMVTLAPGLTQWPQGALDQVNASSGWAPGTVAGASGSWADVRVVTGGEGPRIECVLNSEWRPEKALKIDFRSGPPFPGSRLSPTQILRYGIDLADIEDDRYPDARPSFGDDAPREIDALDWSRTLEVEAVRDAGEQVQVFPIRGIASAYWQSGEQELLVASDVFDGTLPEESRLLIRSKRNGEDLEQVARVLDSNPVLDDDGNQIGTRYTLGEVERGSLLDFGDFPTEESKVSIEAAASWNRASARVVLLELLLSGRGNGINSSAYDSQPRGANLTEDDLDLNSFALRSGTPLDERWSFRADNSKKIRDVAEPILVASGSTLTMRLDPVSRRQKVCLVPVGLEHGFDAVASIGDGDILVDSRIENLADSRVICQWKFSLNHGADGKPRAVATWVDAAAIDRLGGDGGETFNLELRGVQIETAPDLITRLQPLSDSLAARMGKPRRKYRFSLPVGLTTRLAVGDTILLTARDAVGLDGRRGVSGQACRIVSLDVDWQGAALTVEATSFGVRTAGYAPAMRVASVTNSTTIVVSQNTYTSGTHPITGQSQRDSDYFVQDDLVYGVPTGNWAGKVPLVVDSVTGNTVVFTTAHGLVAGATIRPQMWDDVSPRLRGYAFIGDSSETLGAAGEVEAPVFL